MNRRVPDEAERRRALARLMNVVEKIAARRGDGDFETRVDATLWVIKYRALVHLLPPPRAEFDPWGLSPRHGTARQAAQQLRDVAKAYDALEHRLAALCIEARHALDCRIELDPEDGLSEPELRAASASWAAGWLAGAAGRAAAEIEASKGAPERSRPNNWRVERIVDLALDSFAELSGHEPRRAAGTDTSTARASGEAYGLALDLVSAVLRLDGSDANAERALRDGLERRRRS